MDIFDSTTYTVAPSHCGGSAGALPPDPDQAAAGTSSAHCCQPASLSSLSKPSSRHNLTVPIDTPHPAVLGPVGELLNLPRTLPSIRMLLCRPCLRPRIIHDDSRTRDIESPPLRDLSLLSMLIGSRTIHPNKSYCP